MYWAAQSSSKSAGHLVPAWLVHLGVVGVFGVSFLDSSPIPLPIPGSTDVLILILGASGGWPWLLALAGVAGSVAGGILTWGAGKKGGEAMLEHHVKPRLRQRVTRWIRGHGIRTVILAALLPPPIPLLPFLLGAGALGVTKKQLIIALTLARSLRYGVEAALATIYGRQILAFWQKYLAGWSNVILCCFLGLIAAGAAFGFWKWRREKSRSASQSQEAKAHAA